MIVKGNWIMEKDEVIKDNLEVKGHIFGKDGQRYNLVVKGNINALDINAWDINAWNINAWDINAWNINALDINAWDINAGNINARDINAWDINARDINCEKRIKKDENNKTICRVFVKDKSKIEIGEKLK